MPSDGRSVLAQVAHLSTGEVARLLSIHPSTVKRWFRERVDTTPGGHRRIALDVALRVARERGRANRMHDLAGDASPAWHALQALRLKDAEPALDLLMGWIRSGRRRRAGLLLRLAAEGDPWCDPWILDAVYGGFLQRVGIGWACGDLRIGDERAASREVAETIHSLLREAEGDSERSDRARPTAVVATVEPSQHVLGSLLVRLVLARRGWQVEYLGTGVPAAEIVSVQESRRAPLVCVSFSPPQRPADVERFVRVAASLARSGSAPGTPYALALGGAAAVDGDPDPASRTGRPFTDLRVLPTLVALDAWLGERFARAEDRCDRAAGAVERGP